MYLHPIIIHIYIYPYAFTKSRRLFMFQHPASLVTFARPPQKPLRSSSPCLSRECEMEMMQKISMMMTLLTQFILEVSGFISFDLGQFGPTTTSKLHTVSVSFCIPCTSIDCHHTPINQDLPENSRKLSKKIWILQELPSRHAESKSLASEPEDLPATNDNSTQC